jgi:hypothetical protein
LNPRTVARLPLSRRMHSAALPRFPGDSLSAATRWLVQGLGVHPFTHRGIGGHWVRASWSRCVHSGPVQWISAAQGCCWGCASLGMGGLWLVNGRPTVGGSPGQVGAAGATAAREGQVVRCLLIRERRCALGRVPETGSGMSARFRPRTAEHEVSHAQAPSTPFPRVDAVERQLPGCLLTPGWRSTPTL